MPFVFSFESVYFLNLSVIKNRSSPLLRLHILLLLLSVHMDLPNQPDTFIRMEGRQFEFSELT